MPAVRTDSELLQQTILFYLIEQRRALAAQAPLTQARMLSVLRRNGLMSQVELGRRMGLEKSWISRTVDRLVDQGWVVRTKSGRDRRAFDLMLTAQGQVEARKLQAEVERHAHDVLDRLDPRARATVVEAMRLLGDVLQHPCVPDSRD